MARMDEELKAIRSCVTALDALDDAEAASRAAAYVFDRYVPAGMPSRAIRQAIEQATEHVRKAEHRKEVVNSSLNAVLETAAKGDTTITVRDGHEKHSRVVKVNDEVSANEIWWVCKECGGTSPKRAWTPILTEVDHEDDCTNAQPKDGMVRV